MKNYEPLDTEYYYTKAPFSRRFIAYLLDLFVILVPLAIVYFLLAKFYDINLTTYITPIVIIIYRIVLHWLQGETIGKLQMGIIVHTSDGKRISITQSVLRESIYIVYIIIDIFSSHNLNLNGILNGHFYEYMLGIFSFILLFDGLSALGKNKNAFHDIISKTYCYIKTKSAPF